MSALKVYASPPSFATRAMNPHHSPLSAAATALKFRKTAVPGTLDADVTSQRLGYEDGEERIYATDRVTFRVVPVDRYDFDKGRDVRLGWRCIVFANAIVIHDDHGRDCGSQRLAKAYLRRLADDEYMQELAMRAMTGEGEVWAQTGRFEAFMAALDDHYGSPSSPEV